MRKIPTLLVKRHARAPQRGNTMCAPPSGMVSAAGAPAPAPMSRSRCTSGEIHDKGFIFPIIEGVSVDSPKLPSWTSRKRFSSELIVRTLDHHRAEPWRDAIAELVRASFDDVDMSDIDEEQVLDALVGFHDVCDCIFMLVSRQTGKAEKHQLVSLAVCTPYGNSLYVANLCTRPSERRRGIATCLLYEVQDLACELGLKSISGTVLTRETRLLSFYRRLGAHPVFDHANSSGGRTRHVRLVRPVRAYEVGELGVRWRRRDSLSNDRPLSKFLLGRVLVPSVSALGRCRAAASATRARWPNVCSAGAYFAAGAAIAGVAMALAQHMGAAAGGRCR